MQHFQSSTPMILNKSHLEKFIVLTDKLIKKCILKPVFRTIFKWDEIKVFPLASFLCGLFETCTCTSRYRRFRHRWEKYKFELIVIYTNWNMGMHARMKFKLSNEKPINIFSIKFTSLHHYFLLTQPTFHLFKAKISFAHREDAPLPKKAL